MRRVFGLDIVRHWITDWEMKLERHQTDVIEKILRHCGLWEESRARGPPTMAGPVED